MPPLKHNFYLSKHCIERYIERVNNGLSVKDENIIFAIRDRLNAGTDITTKVFEEVPRYILFLYEKYKSAGITLMQSKEKDVIFVCQKRPGTVNLYDAITCYSSYKHLDKYKNTALSRSEIFIKIKEAKKKLKN